MTSFLTALFYLWLVITVLLAGLYLLRRQEAKRTAGRSDDLVDGVGTTAAEVDVREAVVGSPDLAEADVDGPIAVPIDGKQDADADPSAANAAAAVGRRNGSPVSTGASTRSSAAPVSTPSAAGPAGNGAGSGGGGDATVNGTAADAEIEVVDDGPEDRSPKQAASTAAGSDSTGDQADDQTEDKDRADNKGRSRKKDRATAARADESGSASDGKRRKKRRRSEAPSRRRKQHGTDESTTDRSEPDRETVTANGTEPDMPGDTVVDLLDGVEMPVELELDVGYLSHTESHAVFVSPHPDAGMVGTAFADELVRVGYEIVPEGVDRAAARRNGDRLSLRICADAAAEIDGADRRYPFAGEQDLAIEVWTGDGPAPAIIED